MNVMDHIMGSFSFEERVQIEYFAHEYSIRQDVKEVQDMIIVQELKQHQLKLWPEN